MSADHWDVCPRCFSDARQEFNTQVVRVEQLYGQVSIDEFDAARDELREPDEEEFRTFREDYEIYGASEGTVRVSYSGQCTKCGLGVDLEDARRFWP